MRDVLRSDIAGTTTPALGALVIRNGKVDEIAAVGLRRIGRPEQVQIGDGWLIGLCGKPMTTTLIACLDHLAGAKTAFASPPTREKAWEATPQTRPPSKGCFRL